MSGADTDPAGLRTDRLGPAPLLAFARRAERNALDAGLLAALEAALAAAVADRRPALVLSGDGGVFCTGMDLAAVTALAAGQATRPLHEAFARVLARLGDMPVLTIALVDGEALGGGLALAAACDVVIATDAARFGLPEALWGLLPANAAPVVARRSGVQAARRLALTTEAVDADTARLLGLADYRVGDHGAALGLARRLCLRAERIGADGVLALKDCFRRLEGDPDAYPRWALDTISAQTDAPGLRQRLDGHLQ